MGAIQRGHFETLPEHVVQQQTWPHGTNAMSGRNSRQIAQSPEALPEALPAALESGCDTATEAAAGDCACACACACFNWPSADTICTFHVVYAETASADSDSAFNETVTVSAASRAAYTVGRVIHVGKTSVEADANEKAEAGAEAEDEDAWHMAAKRCDRKVTRVERSGVATVKYRLTFCLISGEPRLRRASQYSYATLYMPTL